MIKYFHELTQGEFDELVKTHMTWGECAKKYPQPIWCSYPDAVEGEMGCWSLMDFRVTGRQYCYSCECFKPRNLWEKIASLPSWFRFCALSFKRRDKQYGRWDAVRIFIKEFAERF